MVFGKFRDILSSAASRWSGRQSSIDTRSSSPLTSSSSSSPHVVGFSSSAQKNNLRLSSSLQDLSTYRKHDLEEGDHILGNAGPEFRPLHPLQRENGGCSFSKEKTLPGGSWWLRGKKWVRLIMLFLCLLLFCFLIYTISMYIYSYWSQGTPRYYVVLDCGSTGTRAYVYEANINYKKNGALPVAIRSYTEGIRKKLKSQSGRAYNRMETEPGIDKLVHDISGLKKAMKPLLQWAEKQIPRRAHKSTSLFLYATAGVRRLPIADSNWLLDNVWSILKSSPFLCQREWVKTITGTEEAYYGWIALNYQKQLLGATPRKATYGALDLGGSSLQVTFESKEHNVSSLNIRIGNVDHHLNAYSLSGYGLNDAFAKSVVHLLRIQEHKNADLSSGKLELNHPCLHSGYSEQYTCNQCGKYLGIGGNSGITLRLIGAPNWDECSGLAKVAVNYSEWSNTSSGVDCDVQPCALTDNYPTPYGDFFAISGFFVVFRFFNLTAEATLDDVLERGHKFCEKSWEVAHASVAPQPFIEQYCFRAPYIVSLLREGLHITDKQITIGSGSTTWTLGVSLLEAGNAFTTRLELRGYEILKMKIDPLILIVVLFTSLFFLLFALSCVGGWGPKIFRRSYLPLFRHNSVSSTSVPSIPSPFWLQRWSPISSGDGRVKMPLSPTVKGSQERPFGLGHGFGSSSGIQFMESSLHRSSSSGVSHSYSSNSLGQMQFDSGSIGSFWSPHRSQMQLQSRRSQSREDLSSSLAEAHMVKV